MPTVVATVKTRAPRSVARREGGIRTGFVEENDDGVASGLGRSGGGAGAGALNALASGRDCMAIEGRVGASKGAIYVVLFPSVFEVIRGSHPDACQLICINTFLFRPKYLQHHFP